MFPRHTKYFSITSFLCVLLFVNFSSSEINEDAIFGPGDRKQGYEQKDYVTDSLSITARTGKEADLLQFVNKQQLGLPTLAIPSENPITEKK